MNKQQKNFIFMLTKISNAKTTTFGCQMKWTILKKKRQREKELVIIVKTIDPLDKLNEKPNY